MFPINAPMPDSNTNHGYLTNNNNYYHPKMNSDPEPGVGNPYITESNIPVFKAAIQSLRKYLVFDKLIVDSFLAHYKRSLINLSMLLCEYFRIANTKQNILYTISFYF